MADLTEDANAQEFLKEKDKVGFELSYRSRDQRIFITFHINDKAYSIDASSTDMLKKLGVPADDLSSMLPSLPEIDTREALNPAFAAWVALRRQALDRVNFQGKTVLDVGGYDGEFSGYALDLGAAKASVVDNGEWVHYGWRRPKLPDGVDYIASDINEYYQVADILIVGNVIYHVHDPWKTLAHLRLLCREKMILWTSYAEGPDAAWVIWGEGTDMVKQNCFWKPTPPGLVRLLERTGWKDVEEIGRLGDHLVVIASPGKVS